ECILRGFIGNFSLLKLFYCHIRGIEVGTFWFFIYTFNKSCIAFKSVPGTIIDHYIFLYCRIFYGLKQGILLTIGLHPKKLIHYFCHLNENRDQFLLIFT